MRTSKRSPRTAHLTFDQLIALGVVLVMALALAMFAVRLIEG